MKIERLEELRKKYESNEATANEVLEVSTEMFLSISTSNKGNKKLLENITSILERLEQTQLKINSRLSRLENDTALYQVEDDYSVPSEES